MNVLYVPYSESNKSLSIFRDETTQIVQYEIIGNRNDATAVQEGFALARHQFSSGEILSIV